MGLLKTSTPWWWVFVVCIAGPALALAIFGLRTIDLERMERSARIVQQQGQTDLVADSRLSDLLRQMAHEPPPGAVEFRLYRSGTLVFPHDRMYFAEIGSEPAEARSTVSTEVAALAGQALAAEAQSRFGQAREILRRLAADPHAGAWARFVLARIGLHTQPDLFAQWTHDFAAADRDALSPDGQPVMLLGAEQAGALPPAYATQRRSFVSAGLSELRAGRWWLTFEERKLVDTELRDIIQAGGSPRPPEDSLLRNAGALERIIRRSEPFSPDGRFCVYAHEDTGAYLLITIARPSQTVAWSGVALFGRSLSGVFQQALGPIRTSAAYPISVADSSRRVLWGDGAAVGSTHSFPLRSVAGWELRLGQPPAESPRSRLLWYAFVAVLLTMLVFGVAITLHTAQREMELARMQAEFAAGITHEFKSPITGIRLLMERIMAGRIRGQAAIQDYYTAVCREADRLELLVNRLLETHRVQSGHVHYRFEPCSMRDVAERAMSSLRTQADAKHIAMTLEADDLQREVSMDRTAIQDSIENLLENAIKYSPPDTRIRVLVEHAARESRVRVRDQGVGIDPADLPRIFNRFYRGRRAERHAVRGTGLGLPLVKAVAEGHGGSVEAKSSPGKGSEFCLRIPIREEESCREC